MQRSVSLEHLQKRMRGDQDRGEGAEEGREGAEGAGRGARRGQLGRGKEDKTRKKSPLDSGFWILGCFQISSVRKSTPCLHWAAWRLARALGCSLVPCH